MWGCSKRKRARARERGERGERNDIAIPKVLTLQNKMALRDHLKVYATRGPQVILSIHLILQTCMFALYQHQGKECVGVSNFSGSILELNVLQLRGEGTCKSWIDTVSYTKFLFSGLSESGSVFGHVVVYTRACCVYI
jgi:hypothetical protein